MVARVLAESAGWLAPAVPDYDLLTMLGSGGFATVHLARHRDSGRLVALKVLLARVGVDPAARDRFRQEVAVQSRFDHPHVAAVYDHGETSSALWFTMEHCEGGSLATYVAATGGLLRWPDAVPLVLGTLAGLAAAHRCGIVHSDVKPHNILLARESGTRDWVAKLSDFGLARSVLAAETAGTGARSHLRAGSWPYMPPEQLLDLRDVRPATDVWSLAATCYDVLTGIPPRGGTATSEATSGPAVRPAPILTRVPDLPPPVAAVIDRALETDVARRYADAAEMRSALQAALS